MSAELSLLARVTDTEKGKQTLAAALDYGISEEDFGDQKARALWNLLLGYWQRLETHQSIMSARMLLGKAQYTMEIPAALIDDRPLVKNHALFFELRRARLCREAADACGSYATTAVDASADQQQALSELATRVGKLLSLGNSGRTDFSFGYVMDRVLERLERKRDGYNDARMQWPWEPLQAATDGLQPDDYVILYGRPKSMKTWVLAKLVASCFEQDKCLALYTKEMTPDNIFQRTAGCIMQLYYDELRSGKMDKAGWDSLYQLREWLHTADFTNRFHIISGQEVTAGGDTVPWLRSKVEKLKPDVLFVDGMYLLSDDAKKSQRDDVRVMSISRQMRRIPLDMGVPVIATMQANRMAAKHGDANLDEIAYSDAISQDATLAARVIADKGSPTISILIGGSREFKMYGFRINAVPARDFSFHSILTEKEANKAKEKDAASSEDKTVKKAKKANAEAEQKAIEEAYDKNVKAQMQTVNGT